MDFGEDVEYILETEDVAAFATVATDDNSSYNAPPAPPPKQTPQQSQNNHVNQLTQAKGTPGSKILLIPINSKSGTPQNIKHLFQLPSGTSPLTMGQLTSTVNKKQLIQLAPISSLNNVHKLSSMSQNTTAASIASPKTVRAPSPIITNEVPKRKPCNCTKSQCLKLYCDCFANGEFCSGCNCTNCFNSLSKEKDRQAAISQCLERNPEAFRPKIGKAVRASLGEQAPESIERRHTKGCNCKRSGCLKNYCECYEAKILCSNLCKCCGCKNYEESFERKSLMQLANPTSEHARGILKNLLPTNVSSKTGKEFTKCFITDEVIHASLQELLQTAQQAEKDGVPAQNIPDLILTEMGKCLSMIVDSAGSSSRQKR